MTFPYAEVTGAIIAALFKVFKELGHGYAEKVYQRALAIVLREAGFDVIEEQTINVHFHGTLIGTFCADLVVRDKKLDVRILVEVKASKEIETRHQAQILNYLKCAGGGIGLLVNFGPEVKYKRFVMGDPTASLPNAV